MTTTEIPPSENRDGKPILLKLSPSDRARAEAIAAAEYIPVTTWVYKVFKQSLDHAESVNKSTHNITQS